jgi:GNAT superfamily N-acetyltransferase
VDASPELRPAGLADAPAIARLLTQLGYASTEVQAAKRLASILHRPDWITLVAAQGREVVGFAGLELAPSYTDDASVARIVTMVVDEGHRGRGIGALLVGALEARATAMGAGKIVVASALQRADAHAFYENLGYERTGLRFGKALSR